jgi:hypothetical protein
MTQLEIDELFAGANNSLCVRYASTAEGRVITARRQLLATAPALQLRGALRLVSAAATVAPLLIAGLAFADPSSQQPEIYIAGGLPAPEYIPQPPITAVPDGSGLEQGQVPEPEPVKLIGEIPYEPEVPAPEAPAPEGSTKFELPAESLHRQERLAALKLTQFGLRLEEVELLYR